MNENVRKIDAMYYFYGEDPNGRKCIDCEHLISGEYHDKHYYKCTVYGCSHSEGTDWRKKYFACGLIGKPFPEDDKRIIDIIRHKPIKNYNPVSGQISINDILEG